IRSPLVEEVPATWIEGVHQRRRWVCGFFQALDARPLRALGFSTLERLKAWLIFLPCLSLWINAVGVPTGAWALWVFLRRENIFPLWLIVLCCINLACFLVSLLTLYVITWKRTALVLSKRRRRLLYMLRVNPIFVMVWWVLWLIPLAMGFWMYLNNQGLVWRRTEKKDANHDLIRAVRVGPVEAADEPMPAAMDAAPQEGLT
ncbi:MAG: glycosyl transferase, partial [Caulobacteraceae bacterium]|nr:glycosyl transferase [Caulobacter sp.]